MNWYSHETATSLAAIGGTYWYNMSSSASLAFSTRSWSSITWKVITLFVYRVSLLVLKWNKNRYETYSHKKYAKCESSTCTKEYLLQIVRLFLTQMYTMHLKLNSGMTNSIYRVEFQWYNKSPSLTCFIHSASAWAFSRLVVRISRSSFSLSIKASNIFLSCSYIETLNTSYPGTWLQLYFSSSWISLTTWYVSTSITWPLSMY